jgi:P4 family phage/plasmid primase-like protien
VCLAFDRTDIPTDAEMLVADGVTARIVDSLPVLQPGDAWLQAPGDEHTPRPCGYALAPHTPAGKKEPTDAKKSTGDGLAVCDEFMSKAVGKAPSAATTRKIACMAYRLGQTVGSEQIVPAYARGLLGYVCPPDAPEVDDVLDGLPGAKGASARAPSFPAGIDALTAIFEAGIRDPRKPFTDSDKRVSKPRAWKLGDDRELGQDLAVKLGGRGADSRLSEGEPLTAVYDRGAIYRTDVYGVWHPLPEHSVLQAASRYSGTWVATPSAKDPEAVAPVKLSGGRIEAIAKVAEMYLTTPGHFDAAPRGLACQGANGPVFVPVVDGSVGVPVAVVAAHLVRANQVLPVSYDPDADCPLFAKFLDDLYPSMSDDERRGRQTCLLQFFGAALLGLGPKYEKALVLVGGGSNGKSTLLKIMGQLFPEEGQVSIPMQSFHEDYKAALLADAKVNLCNELPGREMLDGESVKAIITGEPILARNPYERAFTFRPRAAHVFACNRLPVTNDLSTGFFRRFIVLDFPASFLGREDRVLADRIISTELPGILAWALEAAKLLIEQNAYTIPGSSVEAEAAWRRNSDSVTMWLHEACDRGVGWTTSAVAHLTYKLWSERNMLKAVSPKEFAFRLTSAKVADKSPKNVRSWGLTVKVDESAFRGAPISEEMFQ